jgi:hypothetical protein
VAMSASTFFTYYKQVKAYLGANPDACSELQAAFAGDAEAFKKTYTSEAFKKALQENLPIDNNLEERLTTTLTLMNQDRARRSSS